MIQPKGLSLMIPIKLFSCSEQVTQRDARSECANKCMAKNLWAQVSQRQEIEQACSRYVILIRVIAETELCLHDRMMPAIREPDCINDVLLGFRD